MSLVAWVVFGLVAGFIAGKLVNSTGHRVWFDAFLGVTGAVIAGFFFDATGGRRVSDFDLRNVFVGVCGASFALFLYHAGVGRRPSPRRGIVQRRSARRTESSQRPSRSEALAR
ncbi:MAG TPA: GlsB/YeaQ/YmgE family stress response membrane protein [Polyangiaceae bacterium]|nr:GlsB/YeaQ/YmgE family stress response membrane protein [Polyangiaceae bacterium]